MTYAQDFVRRAQEFFRSHEVQIFAHQADKEPNFYRNLGFAAALDLRPAVQTRSLFGWASSRADFEPRSNHKAVIEVKRLGFLKSNGRRRYNEYDVQNGLSQVIVQAIGRDVDDAILVILDGGRGARQLWRDSPPERQFVETFKQNLCNVKLTVLRVVVDPKAQRIQDFEIF